MLKRNRDFLTKINNEHDFLLHTIFRKSVQDLTIITEHFLYNIAIFILKTICFVQTARVYPVQSQVCILKKRPDTSTGGTLRWSLPYAEICFCQGVVAPEVMSSCPEKEEEYEDGELWFIDDPLKLTMRHNWRKSELDKLLDRIQYCGE